MALRLVRQSSGKPNITNKDDVVSTRYSYGGYNGIVKSFGNECEYLAENGIFKVLDGRIVVDGWEIDIDGAGQSIDLSIYSGTNYFSVFAEINVANESVKIDSLYASGNYPEVEKGEDLTDALSGTARILLYNVKTENGSITEVVKKFNIIPYLAQKVLDIEKRLEELGFKEGYVENFNFVTLKKLGKFAILKLSVDEEKYLTENDLDEDGFFEFRLTTKNYTYSPSFTLKSKDNMAVKIPLSVAPDYKIVLATMYFSENSEVVKIKANEYNEYFKLPTYINFIDSSIGFEII